MGHVNYAKLKFSVYVSTDATADAAFCSIFAAFYIVPLREQQEYLNAYQTLFK